MSSPSPGFDAAVKNVVAVVQRDMVALAKVEHAKIMEADPRPLNYARHVDGHEGPEESVRPGGIIVYDYNRLDLIAKDALDLLRKASPVKSGDYVRSHSLFLNQRPVDTLKDWRPGDEVSLSNTIVYARVIEAGQRGGKKIKFSMPPHVYERTAQLLRRAYRDVAFIEFTYRAVIGGGQVNQLTASRGQSPGRNKKTGRFTKAGGVQTHNKAEVRWPTIIIHPNSDRPGRLH